MRFLLDTHVWLWLTSEPERVHEDARAQLTRAESQLYLSVASAWEIGIKYAMGKITLQQPPALFIPAGLARDRIVSLPIDLSHVLHAAALPSIHKDPFDRLLVAQAQLLGLRLVTRDAWVHQYEIDWLAA